jgi:hypothetical protein
MSTIPDPRNFTANNGKDVSKSSMPSSESSYVPTSYDSPDKIDVSSKMETTTANLISNIETEIDVTPGKCDYRK